MEFAVMSVFRKHLLICKLNMLERDKERNMELFLVIYQVFFIFYGNGNFKMQSGS